MNDLQSNAGGQSLDVDLPQIAVVGPQGSGKSSVIENIVGKKFLPKGNGEGVTRRPILIQLYSTPVEEYAVFGHRPNDKFTDFSLVRQEIVDQMPEGNAFSSVPIQIKIYSPNEYAVFGHRLIDKFHALTLVRHGIVNLLPERSVYSSLNIRPKTYFPNKYPMCGRPEFDEFSLVRREIVNQMPERSLYSSVPIRPNTYFPKRPKLTLVDLPGIMRLNMEGEPDTNIREVRNMVLNHIRQKECLVLAVTPANQDIATSEALDIAREVDPESARTIGVLTKMDLVDEGTNVCNILKNQLIHLNRGYVGVVNGSQRDIDEGRDIQYTLERERNFFAKTLCYSNLHHRCGTPSLLLHIKAALPLPPKLSGPYLKRVTSYTVDRFWI